LPDKIVKTQQKNRFMTQRLTKFIHSFIRFNSGSKAHKTTDESNDTKAHININKKAVLAQR